MLLRISVNVSHQVPLASVSSANLEDRRGYLTLVVAAQREGRLLLRKTEGIREWQQAVSGLLGGNGNGERSGGGMATTREFWSRRQFSDCQGAQEWLLARQRTGNPSSSRAPQDSYQLHSCLSLLHSYFLLPTVLLLLLPLSFPFS